MKNKPYPYYELPLIKNLWDMICQQAEKNGEKEAFAFRKGRNDIQTKTFKDVQKEVEKLSAFLKRQYPAETHVAVIGENSYEWLLAFLSIVASGNVAVPIDKSLPESEIKVLINTADVMAVFCSATYIKLVKNIESISIHTLNEIDQIIADIDAVSDNSLKPSGSLACIFFTSGTSGTPKGVMLSQDNLANEINNTCKLFKLEGNTLSVLPFHHSFGLIVAVLMVFNYGYCNFINKSLKRIKEDMQLAKPQTMFLVPLFVETFYKQIWNTAQKGHKDKLLKGLMRASKICLIMGIDVRKLLFKTILQNFGGNLTYIICGGAMLDPLYVKKFRTLGIEILNGYGTTECSPCTAVNRNHFHKDGSVGVLIPGAEVKIDDDKEVWISGPHVMMGYYKNPEATAEVLVNGWYATGDLGYIDENGFLTLTGRKKNLIIAANGENVSPEELENDFARDSAVREILVYESRGIIIAEIYPDEEHITDKEYFETLRKEINNGRPIYKQVAEVKLRDHEFIKNSSKKIVRYKNIVE